MMSVRRRPFLPSRGGDPTLLRGLTPVGAKAFSPPLSEEKPPRPNFPTGIEFRTRVSANLGVEQPHVIPQEPVYSQEEDYSGEVSSAEEQFEMARESSKLNARPIIPAEKPSLRPILRSTDFPQVEQTQPKISEERKYSSRVSQFEIPQQKTPNFSQFGPQTFYSDNPKFQTTITEPRPRPTPTNVNYNTGTQVPTFYQPLIKPGQGQVQVVHFQKNKPIEYAAPPNRKASQGLKFPQPENLEDPEEYDVSFNEALTPISTLHPRNAQTGVVHSQQKTAGSSPSRRVLPPNPTSVPYQFSEDTRNQRTSGPRFAETVIGHQKVAYPVQTHMVRNVHSDFYSSFSK